MDQIVKRWTGGRDGRKQNGHQQQNSERYSAETLDRASSRFHLQSDCNVANTRATASEFLIAAAFAHISDPTGF
jgi:hypothetical protein